MDNNKIDKAETALPRPAGPAIFDKSVMRLGSRSVRLRPLEMLILLSRLARKFVIIMIIKIIAKI